MTKHLQIDIDALAIETRPFIDGEFRAAVANKTLAKQSPVDQRPLPPIYLCDQNDVNAAVDAASSSFRSKIWTNASYTEKKYILFRLADLIESNIDELAILDTIETGRCLRNFLDDSIPKAIQALRYFTEAIDKIYDISIPQRNDMSGTITKEPLGVVGIITPWNDPLVVSMWKIAPALLMGNSIVIKPAEQSTYSLLYIAKLMQQAGLPNGVFNVITGTGESTGRHLALHNDVRAIFFTGSSEVGKKILVYAGQSNMKRVGLECGGKSACIISRNYHDLDHAAAVLAQNIFYNQGQICSAPARIIIENAIKDQFIARLLTESEKFIPGNPTDIETKVGFMISIDEKQRVANIIDQAKADHTLNVLQPSSASELSLPPCAIVPTIIEINDSNCSLAQDEIFGPVATIIGVDTISDAVDIANNTRYGLAASVWSNDINEVHMISHSLEAGLIHINSYGDDDNSAPFGGIKESGIGKDKSIFAFDEYSYSKTTWLKYHKPLLHKT